MNSNDMINDNGEEDSDILISVQEIRETKVRTSILMNNGGVTRAE